MLRIIFLRDLEMSIRTYFHFVRYVVCKCSCKYDDMKSPESCYRRSFRLVAEVCSDIFVKVFHLLII